jgi:hypothetical protein
VPDNVLRIGPQLISVIAGTVVLIGAALAFAFKYHSASDKAGASGHRPADEAHKGEIARPDGFIDSFAGAISEAGGGVPFMATIIMLTAFVTWFIYLLINWKG